VKDDFLYVTYIKECIQRIKEYTQEGKDHFKNDTKTQDAVLRNLHTLTESAQHLSDKLKQAYPTVDWRSISAFRNVVVHNYLGISLEQVWEIVEKDIPQLDHVIDTILKA